ncbi:MAG: CDP-diacylglycerol--glycerol-3-phosphate 3-phosphatidyltransferase [Clostridia bacterium]|nr:CDP-diacylglycerol--glycerol-3-phosphate 3-phosphatidyltransferase [Clostridia bacterium]
MKFKMNVPNTLTMIRIFCTPLMILMFLLPIPKGVGVFIALGIYVLACITDWLDGYIARKYNMITDFGKFMDQIADKFITTTAMILVLFGKVSVTANWLAILMLLIVVLRDILISGIRMVAANKNVVIAADIFGKVKSFFLDLASMILILYIGLTAVTSCNFLKYIQVFGLSLMIIGVALTVVSCVNYTVQAIKKLTAQEVELTTADDKDDE